ncbi:MAG: hypothetical protein ACI8QF_000926, partial [Limisphaerales bacterium]
NAVKQAGWGKIDFAHDSGAGAKAKLGNPPDLAMRLRP